MKFRMMSVAAAAALVASGGAYAAVSGASANGASANGAVSQAAGSGTVSLADYGRSDSRRLPRCTAADLGVWLDSQHGNGAAGTIYYPLELTNTGHRTCFLDGYPGVSARDRSGHQLGSAANWTKAPSGWGGYQYVVLRPGQTAHTVLAWRDGVVSSSPGCHRTSATAQIAVIPPDQRTAAKGELSLEACSHAGPRYLTVVEPIKAGASVGSHG